MVELASTIWADGPSSQPHEPPKPQIRAWGTWLENLVQAFIATGGRIYANRAALNSDLSPPANSMAWVIGDPTVANNGVYRKVGASNAGSWVRAADLPYSFIVAEDSGAGTPNAIQASSALPVSSSALVLLSVYETNGPGAVTVQFNGSGPTYTIKTNSGNDPVAGGLIAGSVLAGRASGGVFRLISDQASAAIIDYVETLVERAEAVVGDISGYDSAGLISARIFSETDGDVAINAAIAASANNRKEIDLGGRTWDLNAVPANPRGTPFKRGKILGPSKIAGQKTQLNSYAPEVNGLVVGREHLAPFLLFSGTPASSGVPCNVHMFGDSTVELNADFVPGAHGLVKQALRDIGCEITEVYNHGVSGTSWSDLNAMSHLGANNNLFIIKYGINDAAKADPLATIAQDMRIKLAQIRAAEFGSPLGLAILLMGPSTTYSPTTNQDAKFYEDLREVYIQISKEFDCCYVDTYAFMQEAKNAPGFWMDDFGVLPPPDKRPGEGLHFNQLASRWFYRWLIGDVVFGNGGWNGYKTNVNWNILERGNAATIPGAYEIGVTRQLCFTTEGFPAAGNLMTERFASGSVNQVIRTADPVPRTFRRTGFVSNSAWTRWAGEAGLISPINGWSNYDGDTQPLGYQVGDDGFVDVFGVIKGGNSATFFGDIPASLAPARVQAFYNGPYLINVFPAGQLNINFEAPVTSARVPVNFRYKALAP